MPPKLLLYSMVLAAVILPLSAPAQTNTLQKVRSAGVVRCGITEEAPGFGSKESSGGRKGFGVDFCRAVAAASLGDSEKVAFVPLTPSARFPSLLSGNIDLLAHTATVTFGREAGIGVHFAGIYFFDGQAFMVPARSRIRRIEDLDRMTVCAEKGTTHLAHMESLFHLRRISCKPLLFESMEEMKSALISGRCQAITADRSQFASLASAPRGKAAAFRVLPGVISKEPLGPAVRQDDEKWLTLVRWVLFALIEAEERGVTAQNVRSLQKSSPDEATRRLLNTSGNAAKPLGLKPGWVADVVAMVGNYGEIYDRNFRGLTGTPAERGLNRTWTKGGLLYAPPFE